jgi:hypothetical protein
MDTMRSVVQRSLSDDRPGEQLTVSRVIAVLNDAAAPVDLPSNDRLVSA